MKMLRMILTTTALVMLVPAISPAEIVIRTDDVTLPVSAESQMGSFEIYLESDRAVAPDLFDWQISLTSADSNITFTDGDKSSNHPYVLENVGEFFTASVFDGGSRIKALDSGFASSEPLDDGDGLLVVNFEVAADAHPGKYMLNFDTGIDDTFLSGLDGDFDDVVFQGGSIMLLPAVAIRPIRGDGESYIQNFDSALGSDGTVVGGALPEGWSANNSGVTNTTITHAFPTDAAASGTYNAGGSNDRALTTGNVDGTLENELTFDLEITDASTRAVRLQYDLEAWGGFAEHDGLGEAAFHTTLSVDEGAGFNQAIDFGAQTTGVTLGAGVLDGNAAENKVAFDSGIIEVSLPAGSNARLSFQGQNQGLTDGYIYGVDNVVLRTLAAGDALGDGTVDPNDLIQLLRGAAFGQGNIDATWEQGDFDDDGDFDGFDILTIVQGLAGEFPKTYAHDPNNDVPDVLINPATGNITLDTNGITIGSIVMDSAAGIFNGPNSPSWDAPGDFAADIDTQISMPISFTNPGYTGVDDLGDGIIGDLPPGFDILGDLTIKYLDPNGDLLDAEAHVVPEPSSIVLGILALLGLLGYHWRRPSDK